jgi:Bacterial PH domain
MDTVYRPAFGRVLTVVIGVICTVTAVVTLVGGGLDDFVQLAPWLALAAGACWATFWRPCVAVSDGGVRLVNVTRTIDVPWPAVTGIETHWALTLRTAYGTFTAWAAPSPGRGPARRAARIETLSRSLGTAPGGAADEVDPGPAADAAALVRQRWEQLRAAGHLDDPVLEHERVPVRWHVGTLAAGLGLVAVGVVVAVM